MQYRYKTDLYPTVVYCDDTPITLPEHVSAAVARSRAETLADRFSPSVINDEDVEAAIREFFERRTEPLPNDCSDPAEIPSTKIGKQ